MEQKKEMTGTESLELIMKMIRKARRDYWDTGLNALLWGSVITFCSLVAFANNWLRWPALEWVWLLTIAAVIPQVAIAIHEGKARKFKSYDEDHMDGIWIGFSIAVFLLAFVFGRYPNDAQVAVYLILYGVPTFATGYIRGFRPMLLGGIACWAFALLSLYCGHPYTLLCLTAGAQLAWFIPGLILRKRYLNAKEPHV